MHDALMESMYGRFGKEFQNDEVLFCEYEQGNDFYLIKDGKVKVTKTIGNTVKTLDILESGDILGEMAILEEQPRSATAIAVGLVKALQFNRANFEILMSKNPALAFKLLHIFSSRIYDQKRRLMMLLLDDMQAKVADVFIMLYEKQYASDVYNSIVLNLTVEDVANWCAQPLGEVQKTIMGFVKGSKIDLYPEKIVIHNIGDFQRLVNQKRKPQ